MRRLGDVFSRAEGNQRPFSTETKGEPIRIAPILASDGARRIVATIVAIFVIVAAAALGPSRIALGTASSITNPVDFRAFYCAGQVVAAHRDPYLVEPLRSCELLDVARMRLHTFPDLVVPAPLPPYALALFSVLSRISFASATCGWFAGLLVATIATALALRRMTGVPALAIVAVIVTCAVDGALLGQPVPYIVCFLVLAASALERQKFALAAALVTLMMIEPHIGLPVWLSAFAFVKPLRLPLLAFFLLLFVASFAVVSPALYAEYFTRELPAHSLSEARSVQLQMSVTTALTEFTAVDDTTAVRLGEAYYVVALGFGLFVARKLSVRSNDGRLLLLVPPAFTAVGGVYAHAYALYAAVPAMFLLLATSRGRDSYAYALSLFAITVGLLLDVELSDTFVTGYTAHFVDIVQRVSKPAALASDVARVWHRFRTPTDPGAIRSLMLIKFPAVYGVASFMFFATWAAFRRSHPDPTRVDPSFRAIS